jgi:hypothetical protein
MASSNIIGSEIGLSCSQVDILPDWPGNAAAMRLADLFIARVLFYTGSRCPRQHYSRGGVQFPTGGNYRRSNCP